MFSRDPWSRAPSVPLAPPRNVRPPLPRILAALAFALTAAVLPASALAQLTIGPNVVRDNPHTFNDKYRFWISKADCEDEVKYDFPVVVQQPQGNFQLWVTASTSINCTEPAQRTPPNGLCFQVPTNADTVIGKINWPIEVSAKAIATALPDISNDCVDQTNADLPRPIVLYFFQVMPSETTISSFARFESISLDLVPPAPPVVNTGDVESGEGSLSLGYQTPPQGTEQYFLRYDLYCDPPPGTQIGGAGCDCLGNVGAAGTSTDATTTAVTTTSDTLAPPPPEDGMGGSGGSGGEGGMGGSGASTTSSTTAAGGSGGSGGNGGSGGSTATTCVAGTCESCDVYAGAPAPGQSSAFWCGSQTAVNTGRAAVNGLQNGTPHVVAMVAVDELGNTSAMSTPVCATPAEATDFYESYKSRGGQGGGGLCALRPWSTQTSTLGPIGAALAVLALAGRRVARRKRDAAKGANR